MSKTGEQVDDKRRERFEVMAVRLANHTGMSRADSFDQLPAAIKEHFQNLRYCDIIRPLIRLDRKNGVAIRMIAIKYGISKRSVQDTVK